MRRVSRQACEEGPLLEEQETEGQRQLHSLLLQQLQTNVDIHRCVAKRQCFAPASVYRPFGEQAEGVTSLSQFQALQEGEKKVTSLREMGLTDTEIQLWQSRDAPEAAEKSRGVSAAPDAKVERLQVIRDKLDAREELLSRPQRFAASRPLSRREMEIEQALFQGNDRLGFLTALFHRDENNQKNLKGTSSSDPMDSLYRDVLGSETCSSPRDTGRDSERESPGTSRMSVNKNASGPSQNSQTVNQKPEDSSEHQPEPPTEQRLLWVESKSSAGSSEQLHAPDRPEPPRPSAPVQIKMSQRIGTLCGAAQAAGSSGPLTVRGEIEMITDEEILQNHESEEGIRSIQRFRNYQPGKPSKVSASDSCSRLHDYFVYRICIVPSSHAKERYYG